MAAESRVECSSNIIQHNGDHGHSGLKGELSESGGGQREWREPLKDRTGRKKTPNSLQAGLAGGAKLKNAGFSARTKMVKNLHFY